MSDEPLAKKAGNWTGLVPTTVALATALFTVMGFLSTRSYLSGLGLPEHTNLPLDGYIQYGGRFFFVLAVHLLPVGVSVGLFFLIGTSLASWSASLQKLSQTGHFFCLVLIIVGLATILTELSSLEPDPIFFPGRVRNISGDLRLRLFLIEVGGTLSVAWLVRKFASLWQGYRNTFLQRALLTISPLFVLVELLLLPLCFGRIAMVPKSFDRVTFRRENEPTNLAGILVFSDADSYFLYTPDHILVEVSRHSVKEIKYEARELLENLAGR
jgi:hypothetical protein